MHKLLFDLCDNNSSQATELGLRVGYDFQKRQFIAAGGFDVFTPDDFVQLLFKHYKKLSKNELTDYLNQSALKTQQILVPNLKQELHRLGAMGYRLGVVTNDYESTASVQLEENDLLQFFEIIIGYGSGYTPKPSPDMLLAFCSHTGLGADETVMVGDSVFDMEAGQKIGMHCVAVLTGLTEYSQLSQVAHKVLDEVQYLRTYLSQLTT